MAEVNYDALLGEIKNYLDITWNDPEGDKKLSGIMMRGIHALSGKIGECDFQGETQEKALLFDYCMYARAGEIPQFWQNYKAEIISLQIARKVEAYAESESETV